MAGNLIKEYVKLVVERRIREADISDGSRVQWGSESHILDLERRLADAIYWRDKQKRSSEKRSYYRGIVNDIRAQLASAKKAAELSRNND